MTVSTTTTPRVQYNGNGVTTVFSTSFTFDKSSDLQVILTNSSQVDTTLTITTHYTVSGGSGSVGSVTMITPPASGEKLTILRTTALTQNTDYIENDDFPAASHELALDRLTYIAQELDYDISRAVLNSVTSGITGITIPTPSALKYLRWNAAATNLENVTLSSTGSYVFGSGTGLLVQNVSGTEAIVRTLTGTTNQITVTNGDGISGNPTIALASTLKITDTQLDITDNSDATKIAKFECSGITTGTTRTLTVPNASGTIALTSDIDLSAQYVTLATSATLPNERVLTAGSGISLTDAGAGSTITVANTGLTGSVLQVVTATKTDTTSTTSTSFADLSGLSASITPSSSSNKVLILVNISCSASTTAAAADFLLVRSATSIAIGDSAGSRVQSSASGTSNATGGADGTSIIWLDSPSTTSSTTYKIQWRTTAGTSYINRGNTDTDSSAFSRTASSIILMEIKG